MRGEARARVLTEQYVEVTLNMTQQDFETLLELSSAGYHAWGVNSPDREQQTNVMKFMRSTWDDVRRIGFDRIPHRVEVASQDYPLTRTSGPELA